MTESLQQQAYSNTLPDGIYYTEHIYLSRPHAGRLVAIEDGGVICGGHRFRQSFFFEVNRPLIRLSE